MKSAYIFWSDSDVKAVKVGMNARQSDLERAGRTGRIGPYGWSGEVFDVILGRQTLWPHKAERRDNANWTEHKKELEERLNREIELYFIQKRIKQRNEQDRIAQLEPLGQRPWEGQDAVRAFPPLLGTPALSMP